VEKVDTGKQKITHLAIYLWAAFLTCSKTEKWWTLLHPSVLLSYISVEEVSVGNNLSSCGFPLPDPAVCFEYGAQVSLLMQNTSDAK